MPGTNVRTTTFCRALEPAERGPWLVKQGFRVEATKQAVRLSQPGHPQKLASTVKLADLAAAA